MKKNITPLLFLFVTLLSAVITNGQTTITTGTTIAASTITIGNTITINGGGTLNMDVSRSFASITASGGAGTATISGSGTLTVTGNVDMQDPISLTINAPTGCNLIRSTPATNGASIFTMTVGAAVSVTTDVIFFSGGKGNTDYTLTGAGSLSCRNYYAGDSVTAPGGSNSSTEIITLSLNTINISGSLRIFSKFTAGGSKRNDVTCNLNSGTFTTSQIFTLNDNTLNVSTLNLSGGSATLVLSPTNSTITNFSATGTTTMNFLGTGGNTPTVQYNSNNSYTIINPVGGYSNLTIAGTGVKTLGGATTVNNNLTINSGSTLDDGGFTLTVNGNIINNGSLTGTGGLGYSTGTHNLSNGSYGNITNSGATLNVGTIGGTVQVKSITNGSGTLSLGGTLNVSGNWSRAGGATFTHNNQKVVFNGSTAQTITTSGGGTETFYDLEIANTSGGVSIGASTNVSVLGTTTFTSGAFTIGSGRTFTAADNQTIVMAGGTVSNSGTLQYGTTNGTSLNFSAGTYSSPAVLSPNGAGSKIKNLTVSGATLTTSASALALEGYVALSSGSLTLGGNISLKGNFDRTGGTFTPGTNTVTFNGASAQSINSTNTSANESFYGVTVNNTSGVTLSSNGTITNALTLTTGNLVVASNKTLSISGSSITRTSGAIDATASNAEVAFTNTSAIALPSGTFTGSVSKLTLNGTGGVTLGSNTSVSGTLNLTNGTLTVGNNTLTFSGTTISKTSGSIDATATNAIVDFANTGSVTLPASTFTGTPKKIKISGGGTIVLSANQGLEALDITSGKLDLNGFTGTISGAVTGTGTIKGGTTSSIDFTGSGTLYFDQTTNKVTNSLQNFTVGATTTATLGNTLNVSGTFTPTSGGTLNTGGNLVITSDASGTGRVLSLTGFTLSGNVTVERFIPGKSARKWDYVTFAIAGPSHTFRSAWQDEIFISGTGTGGATCGSTSGNGTVGTDKYNNNGFDVVPVVAPTIYTYNQANSSGNRWVPITSTLTDYIHAGVGYRLNVRGDRTVANACNDQLTSQGTVSTADVTLRVTGTITSGNVPVTVDGGAPNGYTLLGNPYPCELDFSAFRTSNSSVITNKYWTYSPENSSNIFTAYNAGTVTNGGSNINNGNGGRIASGQSFFVESAAGGTATFTEAHKTSGTQVGAFRTYSWNSRIKIGYQEGNGNHIDEVVVRFSNESGVTVNENEYDAISFNSGNYLAALKGAKAFAISTRPLGFVNDTVALKIVNSVAGSYKLNFSEFDNFTEASQIILIDEYAGTQTNVKSNPVYSFSITSDAASQGNNRFKIVFKGSVALPVSSLSINATTKANGVEVSWLVSSDETISNYVVEKSNNGREFNGIATVQSKASNNAVNYNFLDVQPLNGVTYYRVKSNDKSGVAKYSSVVKVKSDKSSATVTLYPNPVKDQLNLIITNGESYTKATAVIRNAQGRSVSQQNVKSTNGNFSIDVNALAPGLYFITIVNEKGENLVEKFIKY
jgi:hypothetical protein